LRAERRGGAVVVPPPLGGDAGAAGAGAPLVLPLASNGRPPFSAHPAAKCLLLRAPLRRLQGVLERLIVEEEAAPHAPRCRALAAAEALYTELHGVYKTAEAQAKALRGACEEGAGEAAGVRWGAPAPAAQA
jgi:hypothetical protein